MSDDLGLLEDLGAGKRSFPNPSPPRALGAGKKSSNPSPPKASEAGKKPSSTGATATTASVAEFAFLEQLLQEEEAARPQQVGGQQLESHQEEGSPDKLATDGKSNLTRAEQWRREVDAGTGSAKGLLAQLSTRRKSSAILSSQPTTPVQRETRLAAARTAHIAAALGGMAPSAILSDKSLKPPSSPPTMPVLARPKVVSARPTDAAVPLPALKGQASPLSPGARAAGTSGPGRDNSCSRW